MAEESSFSLFPLDTLKSHCPAECQFEMRKMQGDLFGKSSAGAVRSCEPLQQLSHAGICNDVCGTTCRSVTQTEEPVQSFPTASAKAGSCVPAGDSSAWRGGAGWRAPRASARLSCSLQSPLGVVYNLTPTRFVDWFRPATC